jgi:hypothetical protein
LLKQRFSVNETGRDFCGLPSAAPVPGGLLRCGFAGESKARYQRND